MMENTLGGFKPELDPFELAVTIGSNIDPANAAKVMVNIVSTSKDAKGLHLESAKLKVEYDLGSEFFKSYDAAAGGYSVDTSELGFPTTNVDKDPFSIVDFSNTPECTITLGADVTYLNLRIPISFTKKKENATLR
ncbi:hypothetical protein [Mucilaginibacter pocheonensis]|uniref:Uncharacterized protein n=1 Tax=Mucilaginibacter pocheonensis TaxID=398050 RepID=A0ABU1T8Q3_9SPHI|nr:hypothetical protein [Mucilaginibacter pocheonensis]MDR6941689.1 hypothetical protein [Mucilaginibacter pocheonensis]